MGREGCLQPLHTPITSSLVGVGEVWIVVGGRVHTGQESGFEPQGMPAGQSDLFKCMWGGVTASHDPCSPKAPSPQHTRACPKPEFSHTCSPTPQK